MSAPQPPTHRPTPRRLRHILLYGAGGSIALHLGVFATSPLWWHATNLSHVSEPVELLMLDGNTIATAESIAETNTSETVSDETLIDAPSEIVSPPSLAAITTAPDRPITNPQADPKNPQAQDCESNATENTADPENPNHPEKNKSKDTRGVNSEPGDTGQSGETGDLTGTGDGEVGGRGFVVGSRRGNGRGSGTGTGRGSGTGNGDRSPGGHGTASGQSSSGETTGVSSGGTSCTGGCQGRYQGSQTEAVERDPLIRAYRNANGELEFELIRSSGSAEADRAALATAQQASYTSDRAEFTIRARIADEGSNTTETARDPVPPQPTTAPPAAAPISPPEPIYEEPAYEEPAYEEPVYEESADPVEEEPASEEPSDVEPIIEADDDS